MLGALLMLFLLGIAGVVVAGVVLSVIGVFLSLTFGLVGLLLFKVAPILFVGWVVLKLVDRGHRRRSISAADRKWLDG